MGILRGLVGIASQNWLLEIVVVLVPKYAHTKTKGYAREMMTSTYAAPHQGEIQEQIEILRENLDTRPSCLVPPPMRSSLQSAVAGKS